MKVLQEIRQKVENRPAELAQLREQGKIVIGWSGYNLPEEYLYALGVVPVRIAYGGDEKLVEVGARYVSARNCVYIRELLGLIAENQHPVVRQIDAYAFDATCLQTFRAAELVEYFFGKEVFILGVPRNFNWKEAQTYFAREAEHFVELLEKKVGAKLEPEKLKQAIALYDQIRQRITALFELQVDSTDLDWLEVNEIIQAGYTLDKREYLELLDKAVAEAGQYKKKVPDDGIARVFVSGSLLPPGDHKLVDIITDLGGKIVGDDLWSGILPYLELEIDEPTVAGVALGYLNRTPHAALPYLELKTDRRLQKLQELIRSTKADGVIYHTLRYCDPFSFKALETKQVLAESDIPLMEIHTEYAGSDVQAIRTRVEAFLEMLLNKKISQEVG